MKIFKKISFLEKRKLLSKSSNKKDFIATIYAIKDEEYIELNLPFSNLDVSYNNFSIVFEYYYAGYVKREYLGNVLENRDILKKIYITDIRHELIKCNLRLVNPESGKIEAFASAFRPESLTDEDDDQNKSNEKFSTSSWITWRQAEMESPWKVNVQPNQKPICFLNKKIKLKQNLFVNDLHKSLILSSIFREILIKYLNSSEIDKDDIWRKKIIDIAELLLEPLPSEENDETTIDNWIEDVTDAYAKQHKLVEKHNKVIN